MTSDSHKVSVIIPSLGRESLHNCIDALERQSRRPDEIIVSQDNENLGVGITRNAGFARSKGDLIAFTDDDCIPPENWLENMITTLDQFSADIVGGTMRESDPFLNAVRNRRSFPVVIHEDQNGLVGNGANIIFKRSILELCLKHDGYLYQSQKYGGEDIHLLWRIRQRGAKVVYTPNAVLHMRKSTYVKYLKRQFLRGVGIASLHKFYRNAETSFTPQPSLLWDSDKVGLKTNWLKAVWGKVIGPFDVKSFPSIFGFFVFWLGEKIQSLGFLWGLLMKDQE
jgi:glycosyltransferase involved in cell wall biosynthesis